MPPAFGADEEFAVDGGVEVEGGEEVGEGVRDVVAGAGVEAALVAFGDGLDADAVPFPFGGEVGGVQAGEVVLLDRVGEHDRAEGGEGGADGLRAGAGEPGEEGDVRGGEAVPEFLDLGDVLVAEGGEGLFGEAGGDADAKAAGDELEEGEAAGVVEAVEEVLDHLRALAARGGVEAGDDLAEGRVVGRGGGGPDQGDGLGEVADEVVGEGEELGVDAAGGEGAEHGGLDAVEGHVAGDGGEAPAAVGVGGGGEVVGDQAELGVPRGGEGEAVEEVGEAAHQAAPARRAVQWRLRRARSAGSQFSRAVTVTPAPAAARAWWMAR